VIRLPYITNDQADAILMEFEALRERIVQSLSENDMTPKQETTRTRAIAVLGMFTGAIRQHQRELRGTDRVLRLPAECPRCGHEWSPDAAPHMPEPRVGRGGQ
jgi:predicted Zn-ribbon and HTH transcriptional regulator